MQFVNGIIYGAGLMFGAVLIHAAMKSIFHIGIC